MSENKVNWWITNPKRTIMVVKKNRHNNSDWSCHHLGNFLIVRWRTPLLLAMSIPVDREFRVDSHSKQCGNTVTRRNTLFSQEVEKYVNLEIIKTKQKWYKIYNTMLLKRRIPHTSSRMTFSMEVTQIRWKVKFHFLSHPRYATRALRWTKNEALKKNNNNNYSVPYNFRK